MDARGGGGQARAGASDGAPPPPEEELIYLLDSGPIGRLIDGDAVLALRLRRFRTKGDVVGAPPVIRAEMFAAVWTDRTRRTRLQQILGDLASEPETAADGRRAGEILGRLRKGPWVVSLVDAMLAAVAERTPAVVLTDDLQDFARMREESGAAATFLSV